MTGSDALRRVARWVPGAALRPFGRPVAVFFHGVAEKISDPRIEFNHHSRETFRAIATRLKQRFDVLPLAALDDVLARPERHTRAVFLMADDGYANTLEVAAGILEELRLPWTLFVSTRHIETGEWNPLILARLFLYHAPNGRYEIPHLPQPLVLAAAATRAAVVPRTLESLKRLPAGPAREALAAMCDAFPEGRLDELRRRFSSERFLTWSEVETLHRRGVAIGAHADWHWPMNGWQDEHWVRDQAFRARERIMARIGVCSAFAYPFGNVGDIAPRAWQAVRDAGYGHAFTTLSGTLRTDLNRWLLPRYALRPEEPAIDALLPMLRLADPRVARLTRRRQSRPEPCSVPQ
ncbi:MAG: polysaccharide deacetylase family protein [Rhizomicrobium sp.]